MNTRAPMNQAYLSLQNTELSQGTGGKLGRFHVTCNLLTWTQTLNLLLQEERGCKS